MSENIQKSEFLHRVPPYSFVKIQILNGPVELSQDLKFRILT